MSLINSRKLYNFEYNCPSFKSDGMTQYNAMTSQATNQYELPVIYNSVNNTKKPANFKEIVKKADMFQMIYPWLEHPLLMAGTTAGTIYAIDKLATSWGGEYEKSLLGKANKLGDSISNAKFTQKEPAKKILTWFKGGYKKISTKLNKNSWVRAMKDTPCKPEWPMGKIEMISQNRRIIQDDFLRIVENLKLDSDKAISINKIGITKNEKSMLKDLFKVDNFKNLQEEKAINAVLMKRLGKSDAEVKRIAELGKDGFSTVKKEILNQLGLSIDDIKKIKIDEADQYVSKVFNAAKKSKGKVWVGEGKGIFKRSISMDSVFNRMHSIADGAKTSLGKNLSLAIQKVHRGFTFGGGYIGMMFFIVPHLVNTIISTIKAEPEEKVSTAIQGGIGSISWVITMPLATKIIYSLGGLKNIGVGKDKVKAIEKLKESYQSGLFKGSKKELKNQIKKLSKVENQNLATKIARRIAGFFTNDLGTIKPIAAESTASKIIGNTGNFLKNCMNVPMRFIAFIAISGVLDAIITKTISTLFGKAHNEEDVKMNKEEKEKQENFTKEDLRNRVVIANQNKILGNIEEKPYEKVEIPDYVRQEPNEETIEKNNKNENYIAPPIEKNKIQLPNEKNNKTEENLNNNSLNSYNYIPEQKSTIQNQVKPSIDNYDYIPNQNSSIQNEIKQNNDNYDYIPDQNASELLTKPEKSNADKYTYIPSQESMLKKEEKDILKYIPSQEAAKITKTFDNSGLEEALKRADRAETQAIQILNGNFDRI